MTIRGFVPADADGLYDVCLRTGADGADATSRFRDPRLLGSVYVGPYLALEPELAFVLDDGSGRVGGYVLGARDTTSFELACERTWWPALRARHPLRAEAPGTVDADVVALIHHPPVVDRVVARTFPSHLHIDLLPAWQGSGWGRRLLTHLLDELTAAGSPGVHLGVSSTNPGAIAFYRTLGFVDVPTPDDGLTLGLVLGSASGQISRA